MAKHLVIDSIALLHSVENLSLPGLIGHRHGGYGLMAVGIEVAILGIHLLHAVLLHVFLKFLIYKLHTLANRTCVIAAFRGLQRTLEVP